MGPTDQQQKQLSTKGQSHVGCKLRPALQSLGQVHFRVSPGSGNTVAQRALRQATMDQVATGSVDDEEAVGLLVNQYGQLGGGDRRWVRRHQRR